MKLKKLYVLWMTLFCTTGIIKASLDELLTDTDNVNTTLSTLQSDGSIQLNQDVIVNGTTISSGTTLTPQQHLQLSNKIASGDAKIVQRGHEVDNFVSLVNEKITDVKAQGLSVLQSLQDIDLSPQPSSPTKKTNNNKVDKDDKKKVNKADKDNKLDKNIDVNSGLDVKQPHP